MTRQEIDRQRCHLRWNDESPSFSRSVVDKDEHAAVARLVDDLQPTRLRLPRWIS
jgi:hypothetical protein